MAQQQEMDEFFRQISDPLRIAVQRELYTKIIQDKNSTIIETLSIIQEKSSAENISRQRSLSLSV